MSSHPCRLLCLCALFSLAGLMAPAAEYRIKTESGEMVIASDNPDVEVIIRQNGKVVRIIDTKTNKEFKLDGGHYQPELKGQGDGIKLSIDKATIRLGDTVLATVTYNGTPAVVTPPAKPEVLFSIDWQDVEQGIPAHIYQTTISPDGKLFMAGGDAGPTGSIRIFEVESGKEVQDLRRKDVANHWIGTTFAFVPGGKYVVAGYCNDENDKDLYLWEIATGKIVRKFTGHTEGGCGLSVSPDGKQLLSWSDDETVRLWEIETGKEVIQLKGIKEKAAGVFAPDGKRILTFGADKTLRVWDAATGKELLKMTGHDDACTGMFSPDGKLILSFSDDGTSRLWNAENGKEIRRFEGGFIKGGSRGFLAGGTQVGAYCEDQKYRLWNTDNGKLIREIDLADLGDDRATMTASPDGRLGVVNHAGDDTVRVFDLGSGKEIHRYDNCRKARAFSFSPDGNVAVSGSFRAGLFVFRLPSKSAK